jgi:hypothetical protein
MFASARSRHAKGGDLAMSSVSRLDPPTRSAAARHNLLKVSMTAVASALWAWHLDADLVQIANRDATVLDSLPWTSCCIPLTMPARIAPTNVVV